MDFFFLVGKGDGIILPLNKRICFVSLLIEWICDTPQSDEWILFFCFLVVVVMSFAVDKPTSGAPQLHNSLKSTRS